MSYKKINKKKQKGKKKKKNIKYKLKSQKKAKHKIFDWKIYWTEFKIIVIKKLLWKYGDLKNNNYKNNEKKIKKYIKKETD